MWGLGARGRNSPARNAYASVYLKYLLAPIYVMLGETDGAINQLESVLRIPFYLSPGLLRVDPGRGPIRNNPQFGALTRQ